MTYQLDISKEYLNARKVMRLLSTSFALIFSLVLIADVLLIVFANEDYLINLIITIVVSILFAWFAIFFISNFYSDAFNKYRFYKGYESGIKEVAEVEFVKEDTEETSTNKNGLYAYPVHVTYVDGLNRTDKVICSFNKDLGFKEGDKLTITTYRRVIIKAELHL